MRIIAPMMILIMMTSTLAGCTGGDPDSGGEIDSDAINDLIDQNLQDFINNTTITVNQEIHHHYYNNTTVNEGDMTNNDYNTEYNNTTVIDGGEVTNYDQSSTYYNASSLGVNGSSAGIMHSIDYVFNVDFLLGNSPIEPGNRTNTYTTIWTYYDYNTNSERTDTFVFDCGVYYLVGSANPSNESTYWENNNYYDDAWSDNGYNNTMRDIFHTVANDEPLRFTCDEAFYGYNSNSIYHDMIVYEFTIPEGYAMMCIGNEGRPYIFQSYGYNLSDGPVSYEWTGFDQGHTYIDGVAWGCDSYYRPSIGGEYEMAIQITANDLRENRNYRLIWSYNLVPVLSHDQIDLED